MNLKKIYYYLYAIKPFHQFLIFLSILITNSYYKLNAVNLILLILASVFVSISGFLINDIIDYPIDKKNKRKDKLLVKGFLSLRDYYFLYLFFMLFSILIAAYLLFLNQTAIYFFVLIVLLNVLNFMYPHGIKGWVFLGNLYISFCMGLSFLVIPIYEASFDFRFFDLFLISFFAGLGREILKDIQDVSGDLGVKKTLPLVIGIKKSKYLVYFFFFLSSIIILFDYVLKYLDFNNIIKLFIALGFFLVFLSVLVSMYFVDKSYIYKARKYSLFSFLAFILWLFLLALFGLL